MLSETIIPSVFVFSMSLLAGLEDIFALFCAKLSAQIIRLGQEEGRLISNRVI